MFEVRAAISDVLGRSVNKVAGCRGSRCWLLGAPLLKIEEMVTYSRSLYASVSSSSSLLISYSSLLFFLLFGCLHVCILCVGVIRCCPFHPLQSSSIICFKFPIFLSICLGLFHFAFFLFTFLSTFSLCVVVHRCFSLP